ncbi:X8 domain [Dillenia turbinata]|uniref:X8 domain n=1 Tax=Dillenia turbinata TaxID=194707 RepID=A0AAN8V595_9MAGN
MAVLVFFMLLVMAGHSNCNWCVCKEGLSDSVLQKTLDYACGAGADCTLIHQNGACYNPNTVRAHCSYAVNSFFQRKGQAQGTCDFSGTASISTSDPSYSGCSFPASASSTSSGTTTTSPTTTTTTPSTTTTASPYVTTPSTGVLGGIGSGLGPSGMNNDMSRSERLLQKTRFILMVLLFLGLWLWN